MSGWTRLTEDFYFAEMAAPQNVVKMPEAHIGELKNPKVEQLLSWCVKVNLQEKWLTE